MILRAAAAFILVSQAILLWLVFDLTGHTAIAYSFAGHPILGIGLVLTFIAVWQTDHRRRGKASGPPAPPPG